MKVLLLAAVLFFCLTGNAQSRLFFAGGLATSIGGNADTFTSSSQTLPWLDLEYEKKIVGSMSILTGVSYFQAAYTYDGSGFATNTSKFKADYVGIPLMARWNLSNRNTLFFDFGVVTSYMVKANLEETFFKFSTQQTATGEISGYSNRILVGAKFQQTLAINRYTITLFFQTMFKGQNTVRNLPEHWPLNPQQSTYLQSNGYSDFSTVGLKLGVRIR